MVGDGYGGGDGPWKTAQVIDITSRFSPELDGKALLLKTPHI